MTKKHSIGVGLIGVGRHGIRYARHILHDLPGASLSAVCRRHPDRRLELPGAEFVKVYGEASVLIADSSVDVVIIVTPPIFSREICRLAIQARKPVLIEKPLATSAADARAMVAEARHADVPLMTGQTLRFDSTIQELKKRQSLIGRPQQLLLTSHIETKRRGPDHAEGYGKRGALLEFGIHLLDLIRFLTGEEVYEVRCTMNQLPPAAPETAVSARLTTEGGTICTIDVARVSEGRIGRAEWIGSQGTLEADWTQRQLRWTGNTSRQEWDLPPSQTILSTVTAFLQALEQGAPMPITGEDGCRAVEIAEACYSSAQAVGAPITLALP
jgi:predicted dehydrogenase